MKKLLKRKFVLMRACMLLILVSNVAGCHSLQLPEGATYHHIPKVMGVFGGGYIVDLAEFNINQPFKYSGKLSGLPHYSTGTIYQISVPYEHGDLMKKVNAKITVRLQVGDMTYLHEVQVNQMFVASGGYTTPLRFWGTKGTLQTMVIPDTEPFGRNETVLVDFEYAPQNQVETEAKALLLLKTGDSH